MTKPPRLPQPCTLDEAATPKVGNTKAANDAKAKPVKGASPGKPVRVANDATFKKAA